jgi:hypothetical protein
MPSFYTPLPAYKVDTNPMSEGFQALNEGIGAVGTANRQARLDEQNAMQVKRQEARAGAGEARAAERWSMEKDEYQTQKQQALVKNLAGIAQLVDAETDPAKRTQMWGRVVSSHASLPANLQKYGVDPNDHINGPKFLLAEARGYVPEKDPLDVQYKQAQINKLNAEAGSGSAKLVEIYDEATGQPRKVLMGPNGQTQPVGGVRAPEKRDAGLSVIEKKAVFESEDALPALDTTLTALERAKALNNQTFEGMASGVRGSLGTAFGQDTTAGAVVGQMLDRGTSEAQVEWGNLMNLEAIQAMAATLKGATTNFELEKFVEILANTSTPPPVRARVIDRMISLAQSRKKLHETRIKELRSTGLKPSNGAPAPNEAVNPQSGEATNPNVIDLGDGFSLEFSQ